MTARDAGSVIDCDVHVPVPRAADLLPFLDAHWRDYARDIGFQGSAEAVANSYPRGARGLALATAAGSAGPSSSEWTFPVEAVGPDIAYAVANCYTGFEAIRHPDFAVSLCRAFNDWQAERVLGSDSRVRASLVVSMRDPAAAAAEIRRLGSSPGFVQVLLPVRSERPYGNRSYFPVWEAASECGVVLGIHFGGYSEHAPTPSGWPSHYIEEYVTMAHVFQSQVASLVIEGAFDAFPDLRVTLLECGVTWLPSLLWRLDKDWKGLRRETPWVKRAPSEYVREHMRLTIQPVDAPPPGATDIARMIDQIGSEAMLLYASDHPRDHGERPEETVLAHLSPDAQRQVAYGNAAGWYGLTNENGSRSG